MADGDLLVTISGAALSLLFYENVRSPGDQMGLLLGETLEFVVKTYTDSDNQVETIKIHNNIQTVVTCPLPDILHDSTGRINKEKLKDFVHDKSKQVIGWFRFRQNTSLVPTMRDKILHKEFASHFSGGNGSKEEFFVTCLLSSSTSGTKGTHKFRHVFLRHRKGLFEPIPLRINNLGVDSFRHDGSDYKPTPTKRLSDIPDVFSHLTESLNLNITRLGGLESAITIQKAAEQYLDRLIPDMCESDLEVAELERQVRELRANLAMRELSKKLKVNGTSETSDTSTEARNDNPAEDVRILEKLSPSKMEASDNICDETRLLKDLPSSTSQTIGIHKTRNTTASVTQTVSQDKSKKLGLSSESQSKPSQDSHVNMVAEVKMDVVGGVTTRSKPVPNTMSEITKDSISKEQSDGASKAKVKSMHEHSTGMKRARRTVASTATRSTSDKSSYSQLSEQESTESSSFRSTSPILGSKKSIESPRCTSDMPDNH